MRPTVRGPVFSAIVVVAALLVPAAKSQNQLQVGYATLTPDAGNVTPVGSAIFSYTNSNGVLVSQAGVGAVTPTTSGRIFVDQVGTATALAVANPSSLTATVTFTLRNLAGQTVGASQVRTLRAGEHLAAYISELFGGAATGLRGSLSFNSDRALGAIALRESRNGYGEPLYATLPVSDLAVNALTSPLSFPHIAAGQGYTTQLVLVNTTTATTTGRIRFANDSGVPLSLTVNGSLLSDLAYSLPPQGTYLAELTSATGLAVGSATVTPNAGQTTPAGTAIFRYGVPGNLMTEAAAYATATTHARMVVDYIGTQTGVAVTNPGSTPATVVFKLMDRFGNTAETTSRNVSGNGHLSIFVHELFPDVVDPFSGLLDITSAVPIAPVTLKLTSNLRGDVVLTTLPVADLAVSVTSAQAVFPHIALGSGWGTQLMLVNPDVTRAAAGRIAFIDPLGRAIVTSMNGQTAGQFSYQVSAGSGRRFIPGNSAGVATALAIDPATNRVGTEVTVNTGNTVALPILAYDTTGAIRDDFDATIVSSNPDVATATAAGLFGKRAGFSTLAISVSGAATTVTATVVDTQAGPPGYQPTGIVQDLAQRVYLSSSTDSTILLAQSLAAIPATYAGIRQSPGLINDLRLQSRFSSPGFMVLNQSDGSLFVSDSGNNVIRRVRPGSTGRVETFAGNGTAGSQNGSLLQASFNNPQGIALDDRGNLWVADSGNHTIRRIRLQTGTVETVAGLPGTSGLADGAGAAARFNSPIGIAVETETLAQQLARQRTGSPVPPVSLVVADTGNGRIRRVRESGEVSTFASAGTAAVSAAPAPVNPYGITDASTPLSFTSPTGVATDDTGGIYLTENGTGHLKVILNNGSVVSGAQRNTFSAPKGIAISTTGKVLVADGAQSARKIVFGEPDITSVSPTQVSASGGQTVVIQGHNFAPESIVIVGDAVASTVRIDSTERISITTPVLPSGITTLTVQNRAGLAQTSLLIDAILLSGLPAGYITTFAGGSTFLGDGGKAISASLVGPWRVALDSFGNIYIADSAANRVRRISASTGIITTVAGNGQDGFSGDGQPATAATLNSPDGLAVDGAGNIFIADTLNNRVRKVSAATGIITTVAGGGTTSRDGVAATSVSLTRPQGAVIDSVGNLFITEVSLHKVRRVDAFTGIITTIAGNGVQGFSGDGGPATSAAVQNPWGLALAPNGDLYISSVSGSYRIRKVSASTGNISTVLGTGVQGASPGSVPGTSFLIGEVTGLTVDESGNLFVSDSGRLLKLDGTTQIATVISQSYTKGIAVGTAGTLVALGNPGQSVLKIDTATGASTLIVDGLAVRSDEGGSATAARLTSPGGIAVDAAGNVFIADYAATRMAKVTAGTGILERTIWAGLYPSAVATAPGGKAIVLAGVSVYEMTTSSGTFRKLAGGNFPGGFSGDGGLASSAEFNLPLAVCVDGSGNIYVADTGNNRIRKITAQTGVITTIAGNGQAGNMGDNGLAINASLNFPHGVGIDSAGNVFILETGRIRKVAAGTGTISTVVAMSNNLGGITIDQANNIFVSAGYKVLKISAVTGAISTVAGTGTVGYTGDGGSATAARFNFGGGYPSLPGLAFDAAGNLYLSDTWNDRIRVIKGPIP